MDIWSFIGNSVSIDHRDTFDLDFHFLDMDRITEIQLIEQAEQDQHVMAEALRDTAAALNSSRSFMEVSGSIAR